MKQRTDNNVKSAVDFLKIMMLIFSPIYLIMSCAANTKLYVLCYFCQILYGIVLIFRKKPVFVFSLIIFIGFMAATFVYLYNGTIMAYFKISPETSLGGWIWLFTLMAEMVLPAFGIIFWGFGMVIQILIFGVSLKAFKNRRTDL